MPVHLLIHCYAGISRSTATALAILMQVYGQGREEEAVRHLFRIRPQAAPNPRIVLETDLILGCGGQLVAAVAWS
ncbi:dual specificity protein phosphatase family protein [bacterium]|nr:dual specificity protein phosphatase family protein [bacterium]